MGGEKNRLAGGGEKYQHLQSSLRGEDCFGQTGEHTPLLISEAGLWMSIKSTSYEAVK